MQFVRDVGDGILPSWIPIVERQRGQQFSDAQRQWQLLRRGRCGVHAELGCAGTHAICHVVLGAEGSRHAGKMQPDQAWLLPCRCFSAPFRYPEFAPAPLYICSHQRCMPGILTIPVLSLSLISCPCSGKQVSGVQSAVRPRRQVWDGRRQVRRRWLAPGCRPLQLPGASASSLSQYGNAAANLLLFIPPASALRVESIMVSAPPLIAWKYNVQPEAGSQEERLVQLLQQPREWV